MIEGEWPCLWIDATYLKLRQGGRIVSVAVTIAVGVNTDGRREGPGMALGTSGVEPFQTEFLRDPVRRGLSGVKLVISDAHAAGCISSAMRSPVPAKAAAGWSQPSSPRPRPGGAGGGPDATQAAEAGYVHGHRGRGRASLQTFPARHRAKLHSTNPIECLNGEIRRRTDVVGIFPDEASIRRVAGAILTEQTEEWTVQRGRTMTVETLAPVCDDIIVSLSAPRNLCAGLFRPMDWGPEFRREAAVDCQRFNVHVVGDRFAVGQHVGPLSLRRKESSVRKIWPRDILHRKDKAEDPML